MNTLKYIHRWRLRHFNERTLLLLLALAVGLLSGVMAVLLKSAVHYAGLFVQKIFMTSEMIGDTAVSLPLLVAPIIGITLTVSFVRYIVRGDIGHGLPSVLLAISRGKSKLPAKNMYSSLVASTLTVAFGGSVGLEAPIATTGSAIGSNVGRWFHLNAKSVRILLGCGAAGAIAGIFKAPFAGVMFVLEVLLFDLTANTALYLLVSSLAASTVAYFFMGTGVQFSFSVVQPFALSQMPYYVVLGLFCAFVSVYFLRVSDGIEGLFARAKKVWVKVLVGGIVLGILIFFFPVLYGEGYTTLTSLLNGEWEVLFENTPYHDFLSYTWALPVVLLLLIVLKAIATVTTIGSGGVGGTFGPSLVLGGFSGYLIATMTNLMGFPMQDCANFALVGMAAVMTGVMHAPFMATFLIAEITGGYALLVPLLTASAVTYLCVQPFEHHSIYARKLAAHGDLLTHDKDTSAWHLLKLESLIETNFVVVRQGDHLSDLVEAIKNSRRSLFPVLTDDDKFLGVITFDDVRKIVFRTDLYDKIVIEDLMHPLSEGDVVHRDDDLTMVVSKFRVGERYNLVVVDEQNNYIGFISRANTFSAYRRFISDTSEE